MPIDVGILLEAVNFQVNSATYNTEVDADEVSKYGGSRSSVTDDETDAADGQGAAGLAGPDK